VATVVVVGGGAAGCEFVWGLAERGMEATLLTTSLDTLYTLPADRWFAQPPHGTLWAQLADEAAVPPGAGEVAVSREGPREFRAASLRRGVKRELERLASVRVVQSNAVALERDASGRLAGVRTWEGPVLSASAVVLAVGSFLGARLHIGATTEQAGRLSEMAYDELYHDLVAAGIPFVADALTLAGDERAPGYQVEFQRFAPDALAGTTGQARIRALPGVWALGLCAAPLGIEATAAAGRDLAQSWSSAGA
jgi:tRNA U34 5-carboxymethylaminomethyl modifying enzyme MnmG/GidA